MFSFIPPWLRSYAWEILASVSLFIAYVGLYIAMPAADISDRLECFNATGLAVNGTMPDVAIPIIQLSMSPFFALGLGALTHWITLRSLRTQL